MTSRMLLVAGMSLLSYADGSSEIMVPPEAVSEGSISDCSDPEIDAFYMDYISSDSYVTLLTKDPEIPFELLPQVTSEFVFQVDEHSRFELIDLHDFAASDEVISRLHALNEFMKSLDHRVSNDSDWYSTSALNVLNLEMYYLNVEVTRRSTCPSSICGVWRFLMKLTQANFAIGIKHRNWPNLDSFRSEMGRYIQALLTASVRSARSPQTTTTPSPALAPFDTRAVATFAGAEVVVPLLTGIGKWCFDRFADKVVDKGTEELEKLANKAANALDAKARPKPTRLRPGVVAAPRREPWMLDAAQAASSYVDALSGRISALSPFAPDWNTTWPDDCAHASFQLMAISKWLISIGGEPGPIIETTHELVRAFDTSGIPTSDSWPALRERILISLEELSGLIRPLIARLRP